MHSRAVVGVLSARMASTWETIPSVLMFECVTSAWWVTMDCTAVRHSYADECNRVLGQNELLSAPLIFLFSALIYILSIIYV